MKEDYKELAGAEWIGVSGDSSNTLSLDSYTIKCGYHILEGDAAHIVFAARNRDNYYELEINAAAGRIALRNVCDNAWTTQVPDAAECCTAACEVKRNGTVGIAVGKGSVTVMLDGKIGMDQQPLIREYSFLPRRNTLMLIGFKELCGCVEYSGIIVTDEENHTDITNADMLSALGTVTECGVRVQNSFNLVNMVPAVTLRRRFTAKKHVKSAVLYATARGFYNVYINGSRAGSEYFAPGFTDYRLRMDYQKYDVTELLNDGENTIRAVVGSGYYNGFAGYNFKANVYGRKCSFLARLVIGYEDGACQEIMTDEKWQTAAAVPLMYADFLQGQYYDARLADIKAWNPSAVIAPPGVPEPTNGKADHLTFTLTEQTYPAAEKVMELQGEYLGEYPKGHKIYDMHQNMVGTVRIKMRGQRGRAVKLRYGEMCRKDGSVYVSNLRSAANTDVYVFGGSGIETFEPDLTAHGYRYVEITGSGGDLSDIEIESVTGIVISNISCVTGGFECSDALINQLYSNIVWGQRGNYLLVPTDCPQRNERMGWTGDAQVFARTAAYNMDVLEFMRKWLRDLQEAQIMYNRGGAVPDTAPLCGDNRPMGGCAGWGDAAVIVPWEMYRAYGDVSVLEECYPMIRAWILYITSAERRNYGMRVVDGREVPQMSDLAKIPYIQVQQSRGDHLAFDESTPFILSATAYAAYVTGLAAKIAELLGKRQDSRLFNSEGMKLKQAFQEAWVQPDGTLAYWGEMSKDGICTTYYSDKPGSENHPSQTAYALAIDFGLIDITKYPRAAECFKASIERRGGKLSVGFLGISHLIPALLKCGFKDTAFALLGQRENPGWLYSVINGATTVWERWDSYIAETGEFGAVSMNSFNHYAYGAVGESLFEMILGISPVEAGYSEFSLAPQYGGGLTYAKGYHDTPYGKIESAWQLCGDRFSYQCTVPEGTIAHITLPDGSRRTVGGGAYQYTVEV